MSAPPARRVYFDHAATTPLHPLALAEMLPFLQARFGNPSSLHARGREALAALENARGKIAELLGARPREIIFTAGGSEADNLAVRGAIAARLASGERLHIITTGIEHHAVLHTCQALQQQQGVAVTYVPVNAQGEVDPDEIERAIRPETVLISVMFANNEIGTIQPIAEIGRLARERHIPFHSDAVQAGGALALDVNALRVDFLALAAHKFYGPKGVGILYAREGASLAAQVTGGGQERNRRAGTEYVAGIVGAATALELAQSDREHEQTRLRALRDRLCTEVPARIEGARLTGHATKRLANNASFVFDGVEGDALVLGLDATGIEASTGSACTSGSAEASHVLRAIGVPEDLARGSLRLTLGASNNEDDVEYALTHLPRIVNALRGA